MGLIKTTDTVAGEANTSLMVINQYGLRARFTPPRAKVIATTHRASSGTTRTLTLAEPHEMDTGDYFIPGGTSNYNTTTTNRVFPVSAVPAPNKVSYVYPTSVTEAETEHTTGSIVRLGWKVLRIGMRCCIRATGAVSGPARAWGFGIGQGAFPVSSDSCVAWTGFGGGGVSGSMTYNAGPPSWVSKSTDENNFTVKTGATWNTLNSTTALAIAASRISPCAYFVEVSKSTSNNTFRLKYAYWRQQVNFTKANFLTILKHNTELDTSLLYGLQGQSWWMNAGDYPLIFPHSRFLGEGGLDLYVEPYCRYANNDMEIMDIGYCLIP